MLEWLVRLPDWVTAAWVALGVFIASQIEPSPGVWIASFSGASFAIMFGRERSFMAALAHAALCVCVGVFASQLVVEFVTLRSPLARSALAFFLALFAERIIVSLNDGSLWKALLSWKGYRK